MKLLLDTHAWVWAQEDPERLGPQSRRLLLSDEHENHVCTVSTLEIARLVATGGIRMATALRDWLAQTLAALQARTIEVSHEVALEAYALPEPFHKDPADRLLQASRSFTTSSPSHRRPTPRCTAAICSGSTWRHP